MQQGPQLPEYLQKSSFDALSGWPEDNPLAALDSFLRFCDKPEAFTSAAVPTLSTTALDPLCKEARRAAGSIEDARRFFETQFTPFEIANSGFVTGYFEPEVKASRTRSEQFSTPLHGKPRGLEPVSATNRPKNWPKEISHGRVQNGRLEELPDRGAIMDGALDAEALELVWLENPIDAYFVHVQGSARLRLTDGSVMRVGYAGKTGHPYTGIARLLVKRGEGTPEDFTMTGLRRWLEAHPDERDKLFRQNRSYIFFREVTGTSENEGPVGAAGLPLKTGRSLAVDPDFIPYGALVHVASQFGDIDRPERTFGRLMVADDTGSAIKGVARGDLFVGSGPGAGDIAGEIRHPATFTLLLPNSLFEHSDEGRN